MHKYVLSIATLCLFSWMLKAQIGCMDNSQHLQESYDTKTYHYVSCNCPCYKYQQFMYKGLGCTKCKHRHDRLNFMQNSGEVSAYSPDKKETMPLIPLLKKLRVAAHKRNH